MGTHRFTIEGKDFEVRVGTRMGNRVDVTVNGATYAVDIAAAGTAGAPTSPPPPPAPMSAAPVAANVATSAGGAGDVRAPISGVVLSIDVKPGQRVEPQTRVLVLEAMKMENDIFAAVAGTVTQIHAQPQQDVREGDLLVSISPG